MATVNTNPKSEELATRYTGKTRRKPTTTPEETTTQPDQSEETTTTKRPTKKQTHKVYSFWAEKNEIAAWNAYQEAAASLPKREDLGKTAIREYIANHPLQPDEQIIYNAKIRQLGLSEEK